LFLEVPLQFLALWAAKRAFFSGKSLKTEVFRDSLYKHKETGKKIPVPRHSEFSNEFLKDILKEIPKA
jgi:hypothetical protein